MNKFRKVKINFIWQGIYQFVILILGFVVPYIVLNAYGSEVNGLTSTIKQIIILSSLASAGIATAATYSLYKPIQDQDKKRIAGILQSVKKAYQIISIVTFLMGFIGSFLLAFFQKSEMTFFLVFIACLLTSINTVIDLYYTATTTVFLTATQNKHIISIAMLISGLIMYGGQVVIALLELPFVYLYATSVIGTIFKILYKEFELLPGERKIVGDFKLSNVSYAFANEVAHTVNVATQSIIVTFIYGLAEASVLSIYMMVVNALSLLAQIVYTSFSPSFGAVVAEGDMNKINDVFEIFQQSIMFLNTFLYMCAVPLFMPFVKLYTQNINDIDYLSDIIMIEAVIYGIFYAIRVPYNIVASTNGLFKKSAIQTMVTCIITVGISVFVTIIDYRLILLGSIIFYAVNVFYQHFMLKKEIAGFENGHFWKHFMVSILGIGIMYVLNVFAVKRIIIDNFYKWVFMAVIVALVSFFVLILLSVTIDNKSFKKTLFFFKNKIVNRS